MRIIFRWLAAVLPALVIFCSVVIFAQTGSIDPILLMGRGRPPLTPGERAQQESDRFSASSDNILSEARSSFNRYQMDTKLETQARAEANTARLRQIQLSGDKDRALQELRRGEFCSGCNQTRSEILAKGEQFPHPGQHIIIGSASPERIAAKEREYGEKINAAKGDEYRALKQAEDYARHKEAAAQQVINSFASWKEAMLVEDEGRARAWDAAVKGYKERFDSYKKELQSLDAAIGRERVAELRAQGVRNLELKKEEYQARLRNLPNEAQDDYFRRSMQEALFEQRLESGRNQLESFVREVGGPPLDVLSSFTPPPENGKVKVPGTPFSFTSSGKALGVNASGPGVFKASLRLSEDWLRNTLNVDLMLGVDTPFGPLQGGMRRSTVWGPNGTTITDTPVSTVPKVPQPPDPLELLKGEKGDKKP